MKISQRLQIARDLHDGLAQDLVALGYSLDLILAMETTPPTVRAKIRRARFDVDELISKIRNEIFNLRQEKIHQLHEGIYELATTIAGNLLVQCDLAEVESTFEQAAEIELIAGEILRNSVTHAGASRIDVQLYSVNNRICLEISDDGIGGAHVLQGHWGIQGINERVKLLGGLINTYSDKGTRISILI